MNNVLLVEAVLPMQQQTCLSQIQDQHQLCHHTCTNPSRPTTALGYHLAKSIQSDRKPEQSVRKHCVRTAAISHYEVMMANSGVK